MSEHDPYVLPPGLPAPADDGGCDHLVGVIVPPLVFPSTGPEDVDLAEFASDRAVLFCYPRTGKPGIPPPAGWDAVPGARGCTPQACGYRDLHEEFLTLGVRVAGLSAQTHADQLEFARRSAILYPILSDPELRLASALRLPTMSVAGMTLYKRATLVLAGRRVAKVFYPVFPPDENAPEVLRWLSQNRDALLTPA